ncbi:hypothetical protein PVAP13_6NG141203 [Panicum virgatum]|uniref:Uncharacterized protein n=1 Tax=Panicum virgatum TaxID=38727 RepID=A0A8T0R183_PANVG|nr:hypothetical protein PVAP13_6NG141203 [Panicum virgatum]
MSAAGKYVISKQAPYERRQVAMPVVADHCSCLPAVSSPSHRGRLVFVPTEKPGGPRESSVRGARGLVVVDECGSGCWIGTVLPSLTEHGWQQRFSAVNERC